MFGQSEISSHKTEYTNWNAWKIEIVRVLCLQHVAHYIGMDGGKHEFYKSLEFKRLQAPSLELHVAQIGGALLMVQPDRAFRAKHKGYEAAEAAWSEAQELLDPK